MSVDEPITSKNINTETAEGKLLVAAVYMLTKYGPEGMLHHSPDEVLTQLDGLEKAIEAS